MVADVFIKIGDIEGESPDDAHTNEIEVVSWNWGISQAGSMATGGGGGTGRADFGSLDFTHHLDKATPNLMKLCATGEHVDEAVMTIRKSGTDPQEFLIMTMTKVFVTNISPSGQDSGGEIYETVSLQFAKVEFEYKPQKEDGSLDAGVVFKYDIKANLLE